MAYKGEANRYSSWIFSNIRHRGDKEEKTSLSMMELGTCGKLSKWTLHGLHAVLGLAGLATLSLGLWLRFGEGTKAIIEFGAYDWNALTVMFTLGSALLGVGTCTTNNTLCVICCLKQEVSTPLGH